MATVDVKYFPYAEAIPPQPIRMANALWAGSPTMKMKDGSDPQPWHCLPFVEGSTYGLELIYPHETECRVRHVNGTIEFEFNWGKDPGAFTGAEFGVFSPVDDARFYLFNTRLDVQCPPGYVLRTEPHPRYFTDETHTVPLAMIGHLQNEWYPRLLFIVFRGPRPGDCHIFRKGEPFAQLLFVPQRINYEISKMSPEQAAERRKLERAIGSMRKEVAENHWVTADAGRQDNHYKVMVRAFAREGMPGVEKEIDEARERHEQAIAQCNTIQEKLALGERLVQYRQLEQAVDVFSRILNEAPDNAAALSGMGVCYSVGPMLPQGIELMKRAIALQPKVARHYRNLGDALRRINRLEDAEALYRSALQVGPEDAETLSDLGLILAQQGRPGEGYAVYQRAALLGLPAKDHVAMGSALTQQQQYAEARVCFEAALALDPTNRAAKRLLQALPGAV